MHNDAVMHEAWRPVNIKSPTCQHLGSAKKAAAIHAVIWKNAKEMANFRPGKLTFTFEY